MTAKTVTFALKKTTKGTLVFSEVDAKGNVLDQRDSVVGSLYVRKDKYDADTLKQMEKNGVAIDLRAL